MGCSTSIYHFLAHAQYLAYQLKSIEKDLCMH